jgi:hypothetical protein
MLWALAPGREVRRAVLAYRVRWRHVQLGVSGTDLVELGVKPGPHYATILTRVLEARLQDAIGPAAERELLRDLATRHLAGEPI